MNRPRRLTATCGAAARRATYFEVVELLIGTENGYARTYGLEPVAT